MTLFFDLKKLEEQAGTDSNKFMHMLYYHHTKAMVNRWNSKLISKVPLHGSSFILNPETLFKDKSVDILYKIQYIKLAARRDYTLYKQYKYKGLQTSYYPDLAMDAIKHNPLLEIKPTEILFKYE